MAEFDETFVSQDFDSDSDTTVGGVSIILDSVPHFDSTLENDTVVEEQKSVASTQPRTKQTVRVREQITVAKCRSLLVRNIQGTVHLANDFHGSLIPSILQHLQVYTVQNNIDGVENPEVNPAFIWPTDLKQHYVVKRLVDVALKISAKTIENYFKKKENPDIVIGYVARMNRFPTDTRDFLSPSNEYTLIRLDWLKEWYVHSLKVRRMIQSNDAEMWPIPVEPPASKNKKRRLLYEPESLEEEPIAVTGCFSVKSQLSLEKQIEDSKPQSKDEDTNKVEAREKTIASKERNNGVLSQTTLKRIEHNKQRALERRRMKKIDDAQIALEEICKDIP
jgi:hypothetical protein